MRHLKCLIGGAFLAGLAIHISPACCQEAPPDPSAAFFADRLVDDARACLRSSQIKPAIAVQEAAILLQTAQRLNPADLHTLKLLAEAARAAGKTDLQKDTLRKLIAADPGDLVAQVQFLDLLASATEALDERARIYQAALQKDALDPQIRSEMALRLAQVASARGDDASAREFLRQAVTLNDVNVAALRELVRLAPRDPLHRLPAIANLITADPYQPDAWLQAAQLLAATNAHDRSADLFTTALEQMQLNATPSGETYLDYATELALAGRHHEAELITQNLAKLPDAPLAALLIAELSSEPSAASLIPASPPQPAPSLEQQIETRLQNLAKADTAPSLADAVGVELAILSAPGPETEKWLDAYAARVAADDPTLARLRGWLLYRQGKLSEAAAQLEPLKNDDPLAQLGLARIRVDQNQAPAAAALLQELWNRQPTGLLALQISRAARMAGLTLQESASSRQLRQAAAALTPALASAHRQPRDMVLITGSFLKYSIGVDEPIPFTLRITNTTNRPLPVGPGAAVPTDIGLTAVGNGSNAGSFGLYAMENLQRAYRLAPHASIETTLRADQGALYEQLAALPTRTLSIGVTVITAPRIINAVRDAVPSLGGESVSVGSFQRGGITIATPADLDRFLAQIPASTGQKQLIQINIAGSMLSALVRGGNGPAPTPPTTAQADYRDRLVKALLPLAASPQPIVRASFVRAIPAFDLGPEMDHAIASLAADPDPTVRIAWAGNQGVIAVGQDARAKAGLDLLKAKAAAESDPLVKDWMNLVLATVQSKPAVPAASAPTSAPATSRHP